jgi:hypothetical protein
VTQRSPEGANAHLNLHAAFHVQFSTLERFKAAILNAASPHEIELARSAYHAAGEAVLDRTQEQLNVQIREDGIDPFTRRPLRP